MFSEKDEPGFVESTTDWESGVGAMPAGQDTYNRSSYSALDDGPEAEANSDLGNLGRDIEDRDLVGAGDSR
jgi:hypothetical protein